MKTNRMCTPAGEQRAGLIMQEQKSRAVGFRRLLSAIVMAMLSAASSATGSARPMDEFPAFIPMPGLSAEGVAVDQKGNVFVTVRDAGQGKLWKYSQRGEPSLVTTINGAMIGGLAISANGDLYTAMAEGSERGVYLIGQGGSSRRLSGTEQIVFANALAFDRRGTLYVTESYSREGVAYGPGGIWRIRPGQPAELWLQHDLLTGIGAVLGYPVGANGIAYYGNALYVANTDKGLIVRVPILPNGRPGEVTIWSELVEVVPTPPPFPLMPDGIAIDGHGDIYVAVVSRNAVVRIDHTSMAQETVALLTPLPGSRATPLDTPASLALDGRSLFVTNLGLMAVMMPGPTWPGAGLVKFDTDAPPLKGSLVGQVWWTPWTNPSCHCESGLAAITAATGEFSHLGATKAAFSHCTPAMTNPDMNFIGTEATFVAANGDELWATYDTEHYTGAPFVGSFVLTFTGGTGRFHHANGSAVLSWQLVPVFNSGNLDLTVPWSWSAKIDGTVRY